MDETTIENIAGVCHEANRAYCATLGDTSHPTWENALEWQKEPVRNGVRFALANPGVTPAESHANWLAEKAASGWKFGPVKDLGKKEHPCFLPYEEMPEEQKRKDAIFLGVVRALAPAAAAAPVASKPAKKAPAKAAKPAKPAKAKKSPKGKKGSR